MGKYLFIAEKPSVAQQFAATLGESMSKGDGYQESEHLVVTWCLGHLVTMSYPEVYDQKYKKWSLDTLPFIPSTYKYEVIGSARKQFAVVKKLLNRPDVERIYVCTDSGREGEYIYRLVRQMADVKGKDERRVWIDSQTEEEIRRGIHEAKPLSAYDSLASAAYLRAQEDYLMGINFSRALTLRYGRSMASYLGEKYCVVSVGRVMTCVLGMVVKREREIRSFRETPFYRIFLLTEKNGCSFSAEWRAVKGSRYENSPLLYAQNGFKKREDAEAFVRDLSKNLPLQAAVDKCEKKTEKKNPPLLYNLAELQNDCSRMFHISPDQTLNYVQDLYEKKLVTYPRTDARVLSTAISKEIDRNIKGLLSFQPAAVYAKKALDDGKWRTIAKTKYVDDKQITDHYALIPTGQGLGALRSLKGTEYGVYCAIVRRFLSIFYPPAIYRKISLTLDAEGEKFFSSYRVLEDEGYLAVMKKQKDAQGDPSAAGNEEAEDKGASSQEASDKEGPGKEAADRALGEVLEKLRKGEKLPVREYEIREGKTSPPKRYNSGSMILAMENAGQLIEDEELREQIRSTGIGTSATRAEILKKLVNNRYIALSSKTQILTPTLLGEMIYDVVRCSIRSLLDPALTASWEKGLGYVADGKVTPEQYTETMDGYVSKWTNFVKGVHNETQMIPMYNEAAAFYKARTVTGYAGGFGKRRPSGKAKAKAAKGSSGKASGKAAGQSNRKSDQDGG